MPPRYSSHTEDLMRFEDYSQPNPYSKIASSNGMVAIPVGGGRHPQVMCFAEEDTSHIQTYDKCIPMTVFRSTACRDNRIITTHREITEKHAELCSDVTQATSGSAQRRLNGVPEKRKKKYINKVSDRLYHSPEHLQLSSCARFQPPSLKSRQLPTVGPNWGEDETLELLFLMEERERFRDYDYDDDEYY